MMTFSGQEILLSIVFSLAFGGLFAILFSLILILKEMCLLSLDTLKRTVIFDKIFPLPRLRKIKKSPKCGVILTVFFIFIFMLGFSLLSYFSLDGELRLYMLVLAFASFYLSKFAFFEILGTIFVLLLNAFFAVFSFALRLLAFYPRKMVMRFNNILNKNNAQN